MHRFIVGVWLVLAACGTTTPGLAQGADPGPAASEPEDVGGRPGSDPAADPPIPSFQRGSGSRAGGPANELNTGDARATERIPGGSVPEALAGRDLYHGNYCGYGQRGGELPPTDDLDAACKRHDACYAAAGRRSCRCDENLKRDALAVSNQPELSRELRARAASVAQAAEVMECERP